MKVDDRFFQAEKQVEELNIEKSELEKQLYKEDESYVVERELRDSLGLSKEGESVVVLPEELVEKTIQERNEEKEVIENIPNWKKWWNIFFDKP